MATTKGVDDPPVVKGQDAKKEESEEEEVFPPEMSPTCTYLSPKWATKIMTKRACFFGILNILQYLLEMCAYIASANFYSDADRLTPCSYSNDQYDLADPEKASAFFDGPILMIGIFHLLSWLRTAVLFCVIFLGINLMQVWYLTTPVTVLGIVAYIMVAMAYFSEEGELCAAAQQFRGEYLLIELIGSWAFILLNFLPFTIMCMSKQQNDILIRKKDESDEEEDEDGGDD